MKNIKRTAKWWRNLLALLFVLAPFQALHAASVSYFLDQSNTLADGPNYLKVTVSDGTGGLIDFKVETLAPLNSLPHSNFGIQEFSFNTTLANPPDTSLVNLPTGWSGNSAPPPNQADGFGAFDLNVSNGGSNRLSVLTFSINVAGDSIYNYTSAVSGGTASQGNVLFATHVAGFDDGYGNTSAFFGGSTPVPVPAAIWFFGSGLLGLAGMVRRKRK
jgi:hypothetical protein